MENKQNINYLNKSIPNKFWWNPFYTSVQFSSNGFHWILEAATVLVMDNGVIERRMDR